MEGGNDDHSAIAAHLEENNVIEKCNQGSVTVAKEWNSFLYELFTFSYPLFLLQIFPGVIIIITVALMCKWSTTDFDELLEPRALGWSCFVAIGKIRKSLQAIILQMYIPCTKVYYTQFYPSPFGLLFNCNLILSVLPCFAQYQCQD